MSDIHIKLLILVKLRKRLVKLVKLDCDLEPNLLLFH